MATNCVSNYAVFLSVALLLLKVSKVDPAVCRATNRFNCLTDLPKSQTECANFPTCTWCPNLKPMRRCQTDNRACILADREEIPGITTAGACAIADGVWCDGQGPNKCFYPEPVRTICFKKNRLTQCLDENGNYCTSEAKCHLLGCVWCPEGTRPWQNARKCFQKPNRYTTCSSPSGCCREQTCLNGPINAAQPCLDKGCHVCMDDNDKIMCNFGPPPPPSEQCAKDARYNCLTERENTIINCLSEPLCNWCPDINSPIRKCQTTNRACIIADHEEVQGDHKTKEACEQNGGVFCDGDRADKCVYPEPVRSICLKVNIPLECTNVAARASEMLCHLGGCVWCPDNILPERNRNKCFIRPARARCVGGATCCRALVCLPGPNPDAAACEAKGCHICTDANGDMLCNYGPAPTTTAPTTTTTPTTTTPTTTTPTTTTPTTTTPTTTTPTTTTPTTTTPTTTTPTTTTPTTTTPTTTTPTTTTPTTTTPTTTTPTTTTPTTTTPTTTTPTTTTPTTTTPTTTTPTTTTPTTTTPTSPSPNNCPVLDNTDNCFAGSTITPNETLCLEMGCTWCRDSEQNTLVCLAANFPDTCTPALNFLCPTRNLDSCPDCKSHGCEWCGPDTGFAECQASTYCTTCDCTDRVDCQATSALACQIKQCLWCPLATDFKCMNVDSDGITEPGVWTECSRTCGSGSQWKYDETCTEDNFRMCPRVHKSCNVGVACPPTSGCTMGERPRHVESGTCCTDHTWYCGRNPYNTGPVTPSGGRKKRAVGGRNINMIENHPWLALVYINETKKCTGTLISLSHVITYADCIGQSLADAVRVVLGQYDRTITPTTERNITAIATENELSVLTLETSVTLSNTTYPLCLPEGEFPKVDTDCIIAGWGLTNTTGTECVNQAHEATVRTMMWGLCEQAWAINGTTDSSKYFCAGVPEGGPDACTGDKGGPLICQRCENCAWYLAGVATEFIGCGEAMKPTVYLRINAAVEQHLINTVGVPVLDPGPYTCPVDGFSQE